MPSELATQPLRIPDGIPKLLRDLIHERTGLFFDDDRLYILMDKLEPLVRPSKADSFLHYYYLLKDNAPNEWDNVWEALSVQETYFWREMSQIDALTKVIVPAWFSNRSIEFRIWCAACATGEEPYTIAMALNEAGFGAHPIQIFASDASPMALEKAKTAVYREKSFRTLPPLLRQKYFTAAKGGWELSPAMVKKVKWQRANLSHAGDIASLARVHALFCRNVFIYFSKHAIRQTVAHFAARMPPGSHLFTGASESLLRLTTDFELREIGDALAYVRI